MQIDWTLVAHSALPAGDAWLSPAEGRVAAALRRPPRRRDWRLGRYAVKRVVAGRLGLGTGATSLATIEVVAAADGAPAVSGGCGGSRAAW